MLAQEVADYGHLFEHFLGLKKSDLRSGDYTLIDVWRRLNWIKAQLKSDEDGG